MNARIKILILEDIESDMELIVRKLKNNLLTDFDYKHADNKSDFIKFLNDFNPDVILSDYKLPTLTGLQALRLAQKHCAFTPFIIVTGSTNEETSVKCMKAGAYDYVLKENLARLVPAVLNALKRQEWLKNQEKTLKALNQNEKELNAIFNSSPTTMMVISSERKIIKINKTGQAVSGRKLEDIINNTCGYALNCRHCSDGKECGENPECELCGLRKVIDNAAFQKSRPGNNEIEIQSDNEGEIQHNTYLCYTEQLPAEPEMNFLVTFVDITSRKNMEQKLKASEHKFRELADALPEIVFEADTKGRFRFLNSTAFQKFNLDPTKVNIEELNFLDFIHPDDHQKLSENILRITAGESISGNDYKTTFPDGSTGYFQVFNSCIFTDKNIVGFRGIAVDITVRKHLEEELIKHRERLEMLVKARTSELEEQTNQLKESHLALNDLLTDVNESRNELAESNRQVIKLSQALEQSPSSVVITDTDGNIEYVNKTFCQVTGYTTREVIGKNPRILNSGTHPMSFFETMWKTIENGKVWHGEICNKKKSGEIYWENTSISPLRLSNNKITNYIAVKEDITERKKTEQVLKEYTEELEIFNKAMVDRELKIIEMKEEVNSLYRELGRQVKYPPVWNNAEIRN